MKKIKICLPIAEKTLKNTLSKIKQTEKAGVDIIEIWAGEIADLDLEKIFKSSKLPLLINAKGADEKGGFQGTDKEKLAILNQASALGAKYIDLAFESKIDIKNLQKNKADLIISHHFWKNTPPLPSLLNLAAKMQKKGADIIKIACTPKTEKDLITVLRLAEKLEHKKISHIIILMGEIGKISRILIPAFFGGEFTFAALSDKEKTAPGQFTIKEIRELEKLL